MDEAQWKPIQTSVIMHSNRRTVQQKLELLYVDMRYVGVAQSHSPGQSRVIGAQTTGQPATPDHSHCTVYAKRVDTLDTHKMERGIRPVSIYLAHCTARVHHQSLYYILHVPTGYEGRLYFNHFKVNLMTLGEWKMVVPLTINYPAGAYCISIE